MPICRSCFWAPLRALLLLGLVLTGARPGNGALQDEPAFAQARQALEDGLPGVAAFKAEALLRRKGAAKWSPEEKEELATLAAEGWTRDGKPERVLELLKKGPRPHGALFWRGQAMMMQEKLDQAAEVLRDYADAGRYAGRARLALALVYLAQGREALARRELKDLREDADPELALRARLMFNESELTVGRERIVLERLKREREPEDDKTKYLMAQALVQQGRLGDAEAITAALIKRRPGGPQGLRLNHATQLLYGRILLDLNRPGLAQETLLRFLADHSDSEFLHDAFVLLEAVREALPAEQQARLPDVVLEWLLQEMHPVRRGYALYLTANWLSSQGRNMEAAALLESLLAAFPGHRRESDAMRRAMEVEGALGHDERVLALAAAWKNQYGGGGVSLVDLVAGAVLYARGDYPEALARFQRAADLAAILPERRRALYNAAVAALKAGEMALYASLVGQLQSVSAVDAQGVSAFVAGERSGETAGDVVLDRALGMAAKGEAEASQELQAFLESYPDHSRGAEARVALAELGLLDTPARVRAAESALDEAEKRPEVLAEPVRQRIAYTRMWCREAEADWKGVVEAGGRFLKTWPEVELAAAVRMKVADAYFRMEDFANAQTQFELVAINHPRSSHAETALFLAGKCAVNLRRVDAAIDLWEGISIQGGRLSRQARIQQAMAKRREGKEPEALKVVDGLLAEKDLDATTRRLLLCDKAEMLILLGASGEPKQLRAAIAVLRDFLAEPELPPAWLARAGYWLAHALKTSGDVTAALAACHDVVSLDELAEDSQDPELAAWYYRAGFLAVDLLQKQQQWEGAARLAERLAAAGGDRATEAKNIATKIRLERYLWDERP